MEELRGAGPATSPRRGSARSELEKHTFRFGGAGAGIGMESRGGAGAAGTPWEGPRPLLRPVLCECGGLKATFDPRTFLFHVQATGERTNGPRFERLAGKASNKKWRLSVIILESELAGRPIGDWILSRGLQPKEGRAKPIHAGGLKPEKPEQGRRTRGLGSRWRVSKDLSAKYGRPDRSEEFTEERNAQIASIPISRLNIGRRPGDPTVSRWDLPEFLPPAANCVHLSSLRPALLRREASRGRDPTAVTLPAGYAPTMSPSTVWEQMPGYAQASRAGKNALDSKHVDMEQLVAAMVTYISDDSAELPLGAMGITEAPTVQGVPLDVRKLYHAVQSRGGYEIVTSLELWQTVGTACTGQAKMTRHTGREIRKIYASFLTVLDGDDRFKYQRKYRSRDRVDRTQGQDHLKIESSMIQEVQRVKPADKFPILRPPDTVNWEEMFASATPAPYLKLIDTEEKFWACVREFEAEPSVRATSLGKIDNTYKLPFTNDEVSLYQVFLDTTRLGGYKAIKSKRGMRSKLARERFSWRQVNTVTPGQSIFGDTQVPKAVLDKVRRGEWSGYGQVSLWMRMGFSKLEKFLSQKLDKPLPGAKDGGEEAGKLHCSEVPESKGAILESKVVEEWNEGLNHTSIESLSPGARKEASSFFGVRHPMNRTSTASDVVRSPLPNAEVEIVNIDSGSAEEEEKEAELSKEAEEQLRIRRDCKAQRDALLQSLRSQDRAQGDG